jgi:ABC-type oligopeptide transport system ATPase subunit
VESRARSEALALSTKGLAIRRLIKPTDGRVVFQGKDMSRMTKPEKQNLRRDVSGKDC